MTWLGWSPNSASPYAPTSKASDAAEPHSKPIDPPPSDVCTAFCGVRPDSRRANPTSAPTSTTRQLPPPRHVRTPVPGTRPRPRYARTPRTSRVTVEGRALSPTGALPFPELRRPLPPLASPALHLRPGSLNRVSRTRGSAVRTRGMFGAEGVTPGEFMSSSRHHCRCKNGVPARIAPRKGASRCQRLQSPRTRPFCTRCPSSHGSCCCGRW